MLLPRNNVTLNANITRCSVRIRKINKYLNTLINVIQKSSLYTRCDVLQRAIVPGFHKMKLYNNILRSFQSRLGEQRSLETAMWHKQVLRSVCYLARFIVSRSSLLQLQCRRAMHTSVYLAAWFHRCNFAFRVSSETMHEIRGNDIR